MLRVSPKLSVLAVVLFSGWHGASAEISPDRPPAAAEAMIRHLVDTYRQSIDNADAQLGAAVWSTTPEVSFIDPRGHERGWQEIARVFYGETMGRTFTKRRLTIDGDVTVNVFGKAAVVEFNWSFVATLRANQQILQTTGRESQVYVDLPGKGWRLVHVHYSGQPVRDEGKGF